MIIKKLVVGYLQTNCYVLIKNNECLVIDPGSDYSKILNTIGNNKIVGILITHYHFDHIGALESLLNKYKINVYDYQNLIEKNYTINSFDFEVIKTPGHTDDSLSFYFKAENSMFTGDFIFKESVGRWDLETGNYQLLLKNIEKIKRYNQDIIIYPGHGENTTLRHELINNHFFNIK